MKRGRSTPERIAALRASELVRQRERTRLLAKALVVDSGCWEWQASRTRQGYGRFQLGGSVGAHRVAYEVMVGPIPEGLTIDHLCRNRACVNPDHLEAVTHVVNTMRGEGVGVQHARSTACPRGHEYDQIKTRSNGKRQRVCTRCDREYKREWARAYRRRLKEAA